MNLAATIANMKAAGLACDVIVTALECLVLDEPERNSVTPVTHDVTPAAIRMRRMRDKKLNETNVLDVEKTASVAVTESVTERNEGVTTYNILTSSSLEVDKKERIVGSVTRKRNSYAEDFEAFWAAFPTDAGMSKLEASKAWNRLSEEDREAATKCIPAFKAWVTEQGDHYRTVHACRYLSQRRFEGFKDKAAKAEFRQSTSVYVQPASDEMFAWDSYLKSKTGRPSPRDSRGGWSHPSQWPPGFIPTQQEQAA